MRCLYRILCGNIDTDASEEALHFIGALVIGVGISGANQSDYRRGKYISSLNQNAQQSAPARKSGAA